MDEKLIKALNEQVNMELYSAFLYFAMAADFDYKNLGGFSNWMKAQAMEEMTHSLRIYNFIIQRGDRAVMRAIEAPKGSWEDPLAAFSAVYSHEQKVSASFDNLIQIARDVNDNSAEIFLQWFIKEQVEEENNVSTVLGKLKIAGGEGYGLLMINAELAARPGAPVLPVVE